MNFTHQQQPPTLLTTPTEQTLQQTLTKATELEQLLLKLNTMKADKLQQLTNSSQYLDLLASILFALNSVTHSYSYLKSLPIPQQFGSVKVYYNKIKEAIKAQGKQKQKQGQKHQQRPRQHSRVSKQVVSRIIKRNT